MHIGAQSGASPSRIEGFRECDGFMENGKLDTKLNLALNTSEAQRVKTWDLNTGFDAETKTWELIVKYHGDILRIKEEMEVSIALLMSGFAIITIREDLIQRFSGFEEVEYIEQPKQLFFSVVGNKAISCINPLQENWRRVYSNQLQQIGATGKNDLYGQGILIAIIDSGVDYTHPDFRNSDGTTRILRLWDQTIQTGPPPEGYVTGTLYTEEQINEALKGRTVPEQLEKVPSVDVSGHGTAVAGIACGNGRASGGRYHGVAPLAKMLVVKMGDSVGNSFPRTTRLMEALDYIITTAENMLMPVAENISFGNSYGSHNGRGMLEQFVNEAAGRWKSTICIGSGNEGASGRHAGGVFISGRERNIIELAVNEGERTLNLQLWKNFADSMNVEIFNPSNQMITLYQNETGIRNYVLGKTELLVNYGVPTPFNGLQEIYIEWIPREAVIEGGVWRIQIEAENIVDGRYDLWLPSGSLVSENTRFLQPKVDTTLTIPSTTDAAVTVAAYNGNTDGEAYFSGRGYTRNQQIKPDLAAPGVEIFSAAPNGGYSVKSGTSMATPFVTGSCGLLMEWGIVRGYDPYLYGQKVKAYLIGGARQLPKFPAYPNEVLGWGALCVENSLP